VLFCHGQLQAAHEAYEQGLKQYADHAGCLQGRDEALLALDMQKGGLPEPVKAADDLEVQELLTLPTPEEVLGKGFEVVHLMVGECAAPISFLLSTTYTDEAVISPNTCAMLKMPITRTVDLTSVSFKGGQSIGDIKGCQVDSFLQAQIAHKALKVTLHGMLGLPFLQKYDFVFDRVRKEQHFKEANALLEAAKMGGYRLGVTHLSGISLPAGLLGLPVKMLSKQGTWKAFLGLVDTSSMFSTISWQTAIDLGLASGEEDPAFQNAFKVAGASRTGVVEMPLVNVKMHLCSAPEGGGFKIKVNSDGVTKEDIEAGGVGKGWDASVDAESLNPCVEFGAVNVAIGDALAFAMLGDSAVGSFNGGVLIGQDVLAQVPRLCLSFSANQVWLDPPGRIVDAGPI